MDKKEIIISFLVFLILVNLGFLDYRFFRNKSGGEISKTVFQDEGIETKNEGKHKEVENCSQGCLELIEEKIKEVEEKIPAQNPEKTTPVIIPTSVPAAQAKAIYIPLVAEGTTVSTSWVDVVPSEFYFNLADYPGATQVRFICYLQALHGSAKVYARLYDQTNKRAVDYSQLETQKDSYTLLESSGITIWRGNNQYTVQLKSENGTQVLLKEAKLKIIF